MSAMKHAVDELLEAGEIRRAYTDGPALIVPPDETEAVEYRRYSQIHDLIADNTFIDRTWTPSRIVDGITTDPTLADRWINAEPHTRTRLLAEMKRTGGGNTKADRGTQFHRYAELATRNIDVDIPDEFAPAINAYLTALDDAGLTIVTTEQFVVDDHHRLAGTFDAIVATPDNVNRILDIKTGGLRPLARIQLYGYAIAPHYFTQGLPLDGSEDVRTPKPVCDTQLAYIAHVDIDQARCRIIPVGLTDGILLFDTIATIDWLRTVNPFGDPVNTGTHRKARIDAVFGDTVETSHVNDQWRQEIRERLETIRDAGHLDDVRWPATIPTLKSGEPITTSQGEEIDELVATVEARHQLPFHRGVAAPVQLPAMSKRRAKADEGDDIDDDTVGLLQARLALLTPEGRVWAQMVQHNAGAKGRPFKMTGTDGRKTQRRYAITQALLATANHCDDELAQHLLEVATGDQVPANLGEAYGSLTIDEANRVTRLAEAIDDGRLAVLYGPIRLRGDIDAATAA